MKSRQSGFTPEFFRGNRAELQKEFGGTAPIIITANGLVQRTSDDDTYDFRQDSNFWYLTGLNEPNLILVIDKDKEYLIGPELDERWKIFNGDIEYEKLKSISGVDEILPGRAGWQKLSKRLKKVKHIATIQPAKVFIEEFQAFSNPAKRRLVKILKSHNQQLQMIDISKQISNLRMVKQEPEIEVIQVAINKTVDVYQSIGKKLGKYKNENEISADIDYMFAKKELGRSFKQIVAGGKNAVTLHYTKNNALLNPEEILLIDMGGSFRGYSADLTRAVASVPTKRQTAVYKAVMQVQDFAIKMLKPGVQLATYESAIEHYMGEKLRELGLIKMIDSTSVRKYYPHRTSHFLGLDVHDVGDYQKPLESGVVLTVEPGIYIADENIGIRIEDNVLITSNGNKVLSARLSRDLSSLTILP